MNPFLLLFLALVVLAVIAKLVAAAIILLLVAGLIFRTKETVGLLLLLALIGSSRHPIRRHGHRLVAARRDQPNADRNLD
jgi:hypothetical protein